MTTNYITFPLQLTTLSPLHIGNGESISSAGEFLTTSNHIYFLDQEDLISKLKKANLLDDYVNKILMVKQSFDLFQVLNDWKIKSKVLKEIKLNQTGLITTHNNVLHRCIRTSGQAYIPGSSIKGLLRTAILFDYLTKNPREWKSIETKIKEIIHKEKSKKALKNYWTELERQLLPDTVFKYIRPADSDKTNDEHIIIEQVNRQHLYGVESDSLDWLTECIQTNTEIPFELTILPLFEQTDFKYLKQGKIQDLFKVINTHALRLIKLEIELLQAANANIMIKQILLNRLTTLKTQIEDSNNEYAIARMGKGKTLFFNTILPLLSPPIRSDLIDLVKKEEGVFPQTRVLTVVDKDMMGWVKFTFQQPERKFINNDLKEAVQIGTGLKAYFVDSKKVAIMINEEVLENVQLINKYKQSFPYGETVDVIVHQITKAGKINQVKLK